MFPAWLSLFLSSLVLCLPGLSNGPLYLVTTAYVLSPIILSIVAFLVSPVSDSPRSLTFIVATVLVVLWGIRLGGFILWRSKKADSKALYANMDMDKMTGLRFMDRLMMTISLSIFFYLQYIPIFDCRSVAAELTTFRLVCFVGASLGLVLETISDQEKYWFKMKNPRKPIMEGTYLWVCRHPNYFAEMVFWGCLTAACYPLSLFVITRWWSYVWVVGKWILGALAVMTVMLNSTKELEVSQGERYGESLEWAEYKKRTYALIPGIW